MKVTLNKYMPRQNRYIRSSHELVDGSESLSGGATFYGVCVDARMKAEPGFTCLRNHRVDRIEVNSYDGTVNIYTSPITERKSAGSGRKFTEEKREATHELYKCLECEMGTCTNQSHALANQKESA